MSESRYTYFPFRSEIEGKALLLQVNEAWREDLEKGHVKYATGYIVTLMDVKTQTEVEKHKYTDLLEAKVKLLELTNALLTSIKERNGEFTYREQSIYESA